LERRVLLRHYLDQGLSKTAIAELLGINRRTIARWFAAGELDRDPSEPPRYKARAPGPKKLDPFKERVILESCGWRDLRGRKEAAYPSA
jgi:transposase